MNYKALILDHDDTVVNSTATVHYPAFVAYMEQLRGGTDITLEQYFAWNFDPGVLPFFRDIVGLSEEEMVAEEAFWCVVSHSFGDYIRRDYIANALPEPDIVFGWETPEAVRKPKPHSVWEIETRFGLKPEEILVVDDLKPGYDMAKEAGVPFAAAGWANGIPSIENFMRTHCERYCKTVEDLSRLIF